VKSEDLKSLRIKISVERHNKKEERHMQLYNNDDASCITPTINNPFSIYNPHTLNVSSPLLITLSLHFTPHKTLFPSNNFSCGHRGLIHPTGSATLHRRHRRPPHLRCRRILDLAP